MVREGCVSFPPASKDAQGLWNLREALQLGGNRIIPATWLQLGGNRIIPATWLKEAGFYLIFHNLSFGSSGLGLSPWHASDLSREFLMDPDYKVPGCATSLTV